MGADTKIQWCDHTASPWHGCTKVAAGCEHCYAERQALRNPGVLGVWGDDGVRVKSKSFISNLRKWNAEGERLGRPVTVFPSMCDPFEDRPELVPWREEMFAALDDLPFVRLLLLTKRPENILGLWPRAESHLPWWHMRTNRVWLGTSIATQVDAERNISLLLMQCRKLSPVLFISAEPLLEPVTIPPELLRHIDWLIVGGESGPQARPCDAAWIRSLVAQGQRAGVPVFVKQLGARPVVGYGVWMSDRPMSIFDPKGGDPAEWPEDLRVQEMPKERT